MAAKAEGKMFTRKRRKDDTLYMKIRLYFENDVDFDLTDVIFKYIIVSALDSLHGQVGAAINIDVEEFNKEALEAVIGIPADCLLKVWSSLTLFGCYQGERCLFIVEKVSPLLNSNAGEIDAE